MPVPFLAAAGGRDESPHPAADAAPPRAEDRWRRPYRPGSWRVGGAMLLLMSASCLLVAALIVAAAGDLASAEGCVIAAVLLIGWALRLLRAGTWVSPYGLRTIRLLRTRTLPWERVGSVRTEPSSRCGCWGCRAPCRVRRWSSGRRTAARRWWR